MLSRTTRARITIWQACTELEGGGDKNIKEAARLYQAALKVYDNYNSRRFLKDMLKELVKDELFVKELFSSYCESNKLKETMADMQEVLRGCSCHEITVAI